MKVHHDEGLAIRIGPEPCVGPREGVGEASVGERIGQLWSRESKIVSGADVVEITEGEMDGSVIASARPTRRGRRPWHVWTLFVRESGDLRFGQRGITPAFGYSAPHPGAEGTLTPMTHTLPSAHYGEVRLLTIVHHRLRLLALPTRASAATGAGRP